MIDKDEYPLTAAIEQRCVCMVAGPVSTPITCATTDPSSACGGLDHRLQRGGHAGWPGDEMALAGQDRQRMGKSAPPNLVMGSNVQVVWEKFCRYFDVEPRYLPMEEGRYVITPEQVIDAVDEDHHRGW